MQFLLSNRRINYNWHTCIKLNLRRSTLMFTHISHRVESFVKMSKKNMQLVLQHCCKKTWKAKLRVLPPTFKPFLQQIGLLQVAQILPSDWIKWRGSRAIHGSYDTCCNKPMCTTCTNCVAKRNYSTFCNNFSQPAATCLVEGRFDSLVVKWVTTQFNLVCNYAWFFCLFYCCVEWDRLRVTSLFLSPSSKTRERKRDCS